MKKSKILSLGLIVLLAGAALLFTGCKSDDDSEGGGGGGGAEDITLQFGTGGGEKLAVTAIGTGATVAYVGDTGYTLTYGAGSNNDMGNVHAMFVVNFSAFSIDPKDYKQITFTYTGVTGDVGYKDIYVYADTTTLGYRNDAALLAGTVSSTKQVNGTTATNVTLDLNSKWDALSGTVYFAIRYNAEATGDTGGAGSPTKFTINNVKLIAK